MPIISILVTLIIIGVILWLVNTYIPMDPKIKTIINIYKANDNSFDAMIQSFPKLSTITDLIMPEYRANDVHVIGISRAL